ncbi:ribonuclease H [Sesbania bispinosa]|nr:ribonuclease H [Sesbania bispinosa]
MDLRWNIGDGRHVLSLTDFWLRFRTVLLDVAISDIPINYRYKSIIDMTDDNGQWKTQDFVHLLPPWVTKPEAIVVHNVNFTTAEIDRAFTHFQEPPVSNPTTSHKLIRWTFPTGDFIKCNIDGFVKSNGSLATCGGVFRDFLGAWRFGFTRLLGSAAITTTELWGILTAL